ncbi:vacuolar alkaline phosphatase [Sorochytrium milnesiophthora]
MSGDIGRPLLDVEHGVASSQDAAVTLPKLTDADSDVVPARQLAHTRRQRMVRLLGIVGMLSGVALIAAVALAHGAARPRKRNVIMMVSDGFGPASETFGRTMYQYVNNKPFDAKTPLDEIFVGSSRTRSSSSLVTDSAAGATAFSCHMKSYNGAISVDPDKRPYGTVLEAAFKKGWKTGLVVTSRITHATPAAFNSHVVWRDYENDIAEQQIGDYPLGRVTDLMFGGGRRHFVPQPDPESVRTDNRSLIDEAAKGGFHVITQRAGFDALKEDASLPILGLFTPDHMSYEVDRDPAKEPSLKEMAQKALDILDHASRSDKNSPGFFMMIEGSRIDMAAHSNDPAGHAHDILMYYEVIETVKRYVEEHPDTVMVSTSDHETGGLALARQLTSAYPEYLWHPEAVLHQRNSTFVLAQQVLEYAPGDADKRRKFVSNVIVKQSMGLPDPTDDELAYMLNDTRTVGELDYYMGTMVSKRAQLGWSTHGHSAVDINLYAFGRDAEKLRGNHENTEVGQFLANSLDLHDEMDRITKTLQEHDFFKHPDIPQVKVKSHHLDVTKEGP